MDTAWLINWIKSEEPNIGLLKGYKASIRQKENNHTIYFDSRKIPIHILAMVVTKLKKMVKQGILEKVTLGNWCDAKAQWRFEDRQRLQRCESSDML